MTTGIAIDNRAPALCFACMRIAVAVRIVEKQQQKAVAPGYWLLLILLMLHETLQYIFRALLQPVLIIRSVIRSIYLVAIRS